MIRFMADADLKIAIVRGCLRREPSMDFLSAGEAGLTGLSDLNVLAIAARQDRVLVSHDLKTMPKHLVEFLRTHDSSPGVVVVPQRLPIGRAIDELLLIWGASGPNEWKERVSVLPL